jgi:hypothetical protein
VVRGEEIDEVLLSLVDRGPTVEAAAAGTLGEELAAAGRDAARCARAVIELARTRLVAALPAALGQLREALSADDSFPSLVAAGDDLRLLHTWRDALPTHGDADLGRLVAAAWERACLVLPQIAATADDEAEPVLEALISLSRPALAGEADRALLVDRLWLVARDGEAQPLVRGACHGLLATLGATTPRAIARELHATLSGSLAQVRRGGALLEGVLRTSRSSFLVGPRLLAAVHEVVLRLGEEEFVAVLPDLRRAFAVFVPAELERIGERVERLLATGDVDPERDFVLSPEAAEIARRVDASIVPRL